MGKWQSWMELDALRLSNGFLIVVGVVMGITASFVTCLGLNLQKQSLCEPANEHISPLKQPKWLAGLTCVIVGSIIDFMSFGLAPQSLIAPLAALSLVWNLGMASYLLGEQYSRVDLHATGLIFLGTAVTIANASHEEKEFTLDDLRSLWMKERMFGYSFVILLLVALHYFLVWIVDKQNLMGPKWKFLEMLGYTGFAGIVGGQSLLFAKSTVEMIKFAFHGGDSFYHVETYFIVAMLVVCLLLQINFLNGGLKNFDSLYVIPCYESYWIIAGEVGGLVYFGEWEELGPSKKFMFIVGTLITICGIYILTTKEKPDGKDGVEMFKRNPSEFITDDDDEDNVEANLISRGPRN